MGEGEVRGLGRLPKTVDTDQKNGDTQLQELELSCKNVNNFVIVSVKLAMHIIEAITDTAAQVMVVNTDVFTNLFGRDIALKDIIRLKCAGANQYVSQSLYRHTNYNWFSNCITACVCCKHKR